MRRPFANPSVSSSGRRFQSLRAEKQCICTRSQRYEADKIVIMDSGSILRNTCSTPLTKWSLSPHVGKHTFPIRNHEARKGPTHVLVVLALMKVVRWTGNRKRNPLLACRTLSYLTCFCSTHRHCRLGHAFLGLSNGENDLKIHYGWYSQYCFGAPRSMCLRARAGNRSAEHVLAQVRIRIGRWNARPSWLLWQSPIRREILSGTLNRAYVEIHGMHGRFGAARYITAAAMVAFLASGSAGPASALAAIAVATAQRLMFKKCTFVAHIAHADMAQATLPTMPVKSYRAGRCRCVYHALRIPCVLKM